ncbi:hypothetical protein ADIARSV_0034 [Arcticibacter svalbardensis MN12-7]|uniref:Uncharacterized protein n=1 Tax=Arcticibacter svalbardensis MN12-7 TaxID=1150600 RepID=R9GYE4_9SPHI|nr:hypothetical protein [Arcticibacter svalbardensis]EOR96771.1 hypothetical protein ADIARSV_0034 [Arcticibacter svalbardensis MN12-7]
MKHKKDELQNIIIGNGQDGHTSQLKKTIVSLGVMRMQVKNIKDKSLKLKKNTSD